MQELVVGSAFGRGGGNVRALEAGDDTAEAADSGAVCAPLTFTPDSVELDPASTAEVTVDGCAADFTVSCPSWATLTLGDPAVAGDVAVVESLPGWSGPADGECVVAWEVGEGVLLVHIEAL